MHKIFCFNMTETLLDRLVNDESLENERATIEGIRWNYTSNNGLSSDTVTGSEAERVRRAFQIASPSGEGWSEINMTADYRFFRTEAPEAYDGFGTITVARDGERARVVAVVQRHVEWQTGRYGSGLYPALSVNND